MSQMMNDTATDAKKSCKLSYTSDIIDISNNINHVYNNSMFTITFFNKFAKISLKIIM